MKKSSTEDDYPCGGDDGVFVAQRAKHSIPRVQVRGTQVLSQATSWGRFDATTECKLELRRRVLSCGFLIQSWVEKVSNSRVHCWSRSVGGSYPCMSSGAGHIHSAGSSRDIIWSSTYSVVPGVSQSPDDKLPETGRDSSRGRKRRREGDG